MIDVLPPFKGVMAPKTGKARRDVDVDNKPHG
jgi:hypothetical protein